jgi:hypothetical protein
MDYWPFLFLSWSSTFPKLVAVFMAFHGGITWEGISWHLLDTNAIGAFLSHPFGS